MRFPFPVRAQANFTHSFYSVVRSLVAAAPIENVKVNVKPLTEPEIESGVPLTIKQPRATVVPKR